MFRKNVQILDHSLPAFTWVELPTGLKTMTQWKRRGRKVRKGEMPVARLTWDAMEWRESDRFNPDGTVEKIRERVSVLRECGVFSVEQTRPYKATERTWAIEVYRRYFVEFTSRDYYIYWADPADPCWAKLKNGWPFEGEKKAGWKYGNGPLTDELLNRHLNGNGRYGVRGGKCTRFAAFDLDLHDGGDTGVFLDQLRVLLDEFHGKDGWHFQVANQNAGGIHLIQCFREKRLTEEVRAELRNRLQELDKRHPELAARARAANMKTLAELEIGSSGFPVGQL